MTCTPAGHPNDPRGRARVHVQADAEQRQTGGLANGT